MSGLIEKRALGAPIRAVSALLMMGAVTVGCGDDDPTPPPQDAAAADTGTTTDAGDAGAGEDVPVATDRPMVTDVPVAMDVPSTDVPATDVPVAMDVPSTDVPATDVPVAMDVPSTDVPAADVPPSQDAPAATISVRVAHLSPGAPAVDVCLRPASATAWTGVTPTLAGLGVTAGLSYSQVTSYLTVPAGAYTVRIVAPGSANCDTALAGLPDTTLPALAAGTRATVGAVGLLGEMGATAFRLNPYVEDEPAATGSLKVRFVHASPGTPAVDLGIPGMGTEFTAVFGNVAFPNAGSPNFTSTTALNNISLAARVAGTPTAAGMYPLQIDGVSVPLGATVTAFAIGRLGNSETPLSALVCTDGAAAMGNPALTACAVLTNRPPPARINVRVAHLGADAPPVDFCLRPASATSWSGVSPTLRGLDAPAGLAYTQVTRYLELDAGAYTVRLVAPGSANCDASLGGLPDTTLPALAGGTRATVTAVGRIFNNDFRLAPLVDDSTAAPMGQARIRFVHASAGTPAVDVGIPGAATAFTGVFNNVAFPTGSDYVNTAPLADVSLAARVAGTATNAGAYPVQVNGVSVPAGARVTFFAVGLLNNDQVPLSVLACDEGAGPSGLLTPCTLLPARAFVRVAHFAPDAPAVDFCIRPASSPDFAGVQPTLKSLGVGGGISYPALTRYLPLAPDTYVVRIVGPNSPNCLTALAGLPDTTLPALAAGARVTVAASGRLADMGATAFALRPFVDGNVRPPLGRAALRFLHLSPGSPAVDVGLVSGSTFTPVFANTAFGAAGTAAGVDPTTRYLTTDPIAGATLQVRPAGAPTPVLSITPFNLPSPVFRGMALTVFALGELEGTGNRRLSALACLDREPASAITAPCARY